MGQNDYMMLFIYDLYNILDIDEVSDMDILELFNGFVIRNYNKNKRLFNKILFGIPDASEIISEDKKNKLSSDERLTSLIMNEDLVEKLPVVDIVNKVNMTFSINKNVIKIFDELEKYDKIAINQIGALAQSFANYIHVMSDMNIKRLRS